MNSRLKIFLAILGMTAFISVESEAKQQRQLFLRYTDHVELGRATNLKMSDLKKTTAWRNLPNRYKKLIDDKRPEFGVKISKYPDSGLLALYMGDDCEIAIPRDGLDLFVYPKKLTRDLWVNPLPPREKMTMKDPKTNKPWIEHSPFYKQMTKEDKAYEDAMLSAVNEVIHLLMLDYTNIRRIKNKLGYNIIGMFALKPTAHPINNENPEGLTEDQVEAYNTFGKVLWNPLEKPGFNGISVFSACGYRDIDIHGVKGETFESLDIILKQFCCAYVMSTERLEKQGKIQVAINAKEGLENLLKKYDLDPLELGDPDKTLTARQAFLSYLYQVATPIFNNIVGLIKENAGTPPPNMSPLHHKIFGSHGLVVIPKKIAITDSRITDTIPDNRCRRHF